MKKLGIIVLFDPEGQIDNSKFILINNFNEVLDELIVVVNGNINEYSKNQLSSKYKSVIFRENYGYDGGAYKDVLLNYLTRNYLEQFDEIYLSNDSYYGPFFSWNQVFDVMDQEVVDFWGLTRYEKDDLYEEHIQGYFLAIRKSMFSSEIFWDFWHDIVYPKSYQEAVDTFEVRFTQYHHQQGFRFTSFADVVIPEIKAERGQNIYLIKAYELLSTGKFPILKRKALDDYSYVRNDQLLSLIEEKTNYDTDLIRASFERLCRAKKIGITNYYYLKEFYMTHTKVYIFGNGHYGKKIQEAFQYERWKYEGVVVSTTIERCSEKLILIDELVLKPSEGLIVILGKKAMEEVKESLLDRFNRGQLLFPFE